MGSAFLSLKNFPFNVRRSQTSTNSNTNIEIIHSMLRVFHCWHQYSIVKYFVLTYVASSSLFVTVVIKLMIFLYYNIILFVGKKMYQHSSYC